MNSSNAPHRTIGRAMAWDEAAEKWRIRRLGLPRWAFIRRRAMTKTIEDAEMNALAALSQARREAGS